jgi:glycosyltransferase involved in cell wall biosynthesis
VTSPLRRADKFTQTCSIIRTGPQMRRNCQDSSGSSTNNLHVPLKSPNRVCEVAVVVPCHNAASYLARALDSILAQTHGDLRLFAVDDGSTDETPNILKGYSDYGFCFRQERAGQAAARNRGIRMSDSPYIAFLDADDYWLPTKLERQIAVLRQNPSVGLVCSDCETIKQGQFVGAHFGRAKVPPTGKLFERLVRDCFVFTPTVVVRRKCLEEVGLFNESLSVSEDFNLWLRIAARWEIAVVPEVLAVRDTHPEGLSLSTRPEIYLENGIAALENVKSACNELSSAESRALQDAIAERYYVYGSHLLATGARTESRTKLSAALRRQPALGRAWVKFGLSFLPGGAFRRLMEARRSFTRMGE